MENIFEIAARNTRRANEVIRDSEIVPIWESIGATINQVGSLRTGLLMKHRDIDFHIYTERFDLSESFRAMSKLAANPSVDNITFRNLIHTPEECVEWHAWYRDADGELWQFDMIHILRGSTYDGFFESVADRICEVLTPQTRATILELKYLTPDDLKIMGVEYYKAVLTDGIKTFPQLLEWRKDNPADSFMDWMP